MFFIKGFLELSGALSKGKLNQRDDLCVCVFVSCISQFVSKVLSTSAGLMTSNGL